ncbi:MAG TPA: YdeI/OmpD-associated family protein [Flavisolibacter sp.]|nr:YdeI/OmpD-associated family protein [Flavisolibacter sp.]
MLRCTLTIEKFAKQGEKTGWTYIRFSEEQAMEVKPGTKTSFRVKGKLDDVSIERVALLPMGDGSFILPLNAALRKAIRKSKGDQVKVCLEADESPLALDADFLDCLQDEPQALHTFQQLAKGHQNYFSKWIESARTTPTKTKRIAMAVNALANGMGFPEMLRARKKEKQQTGF